MPDYYSWIDAIIDDLPRPEYAKQPESLLTDLLWRSPGSNLSELLSDTKLPRLIPRQLRQSKAKDKSTETFPLALSADINGLIEDTNPVSRSMKPLLESILAPKSKGDVFHACVPIHPDTVALQTLHGIVNKNSPPNLAKVIEAVGWLGGASVKGEVAKCFIKCYSNPAKPSDGLVGITDNIFPIIANHTWQELAKGYASIENWPGIRSRQIDPGSSAKSLLASKSTKTPFSWFWSKWETLCDPDMGWFETLPTRRFVDWATCLLRTTLSFAYLWEAEFFLRLYFSIMERKNNIDRNENQLSAIEAFRSMLENGAILATIEPITIPASQKHAWNAINTLLSKGQQVRTLVEKFLKEKPPFMINIDDYKDEPIIAIIEDWLTSLDAGDLEILSQPISAEAGAVKGTREFVRYLLQPRSSDDDRRDQADFYYLARTNSKRNFWFHPGPEWLVVVTSLLCQKPEGECTLGQLQDDLRKLGIRVDREVLVSFLEASGLSTDSPDADNALIIKSGF